MKSIFGTFFISLFFFNSSSQVNLTNGLYICYPLNGNATDYSGNANNGTLIGPVAATDRFGNAGMALSFNGTTNYVSINNAFPNMGHFTFSVWVYHTNPSHPSGILSDATPVGYADLFFNVSNDGVGIDANKAPGTVNRIDIYPLGNYNPAVQGQSLNNAWHHIVWVCDSTNQKVYIDTLLKANLNVTGTNKNYHISQPYLGRLGDGNQIFQYFSGRMDDFRMYSRALSFNEVKALYELNGSCNDSSIVSCTPTINTINATICSGDVYDFYGTQISTAGTFYDTLVNALGCDSSVTLHLGLLSSSANYPSQKLCDGDSIFLQGAYQTTPGTYYDTLVSATGCDSFVVTTIAMDYVNDSVIVHGDTLTADATGLLYQWYNCDSSANITGATQQSYVPIQSGNYAVWLSEETGCYKLSDCFLMLVEGVTELINEVDAISIFPDAANKQVIIKIKNEIVPAQIDLFNVMGQGVRTITVTAPSQTEDLSALHTGIYFYHIRSKQKTYSGKFFIE